MINKLLNSAKKKLVNIPGWRTNRRIIVIESDDWGMIRMASRQSYNWFLEKGYEVDQCPFNRYDSIESNDDLELLFEVLKSVEDKNANPAVITANNIVANPDFGKIRNSFFREYYYEPFTKTLERYPGRDRIIELYKEGMAQKIFRPQFHGREHLNINRWMAELNSGNKTLMDAFDWEMYAVHKSGKINGRRDNLDAFGLGYEKEWVKSDKVIRTGLDLFEDLWDYRSTSFIAPCFVWPSKIEKFMSEEGVKYIQGTHVQRVPLSGRELRTGRKYHYQGQRNHLGQRYLVRNVSFEPAVFPKEDSVSRALSEISCAFRYKKPAIISSHRLNYIGSINRKNRDRNLGYLKNLLNNILKKWPDVEFMTTEELGRCMNYDS